MKKIVVFSIVSVLLFVNRTYANPVSGSCSAISDMCVEFEAGYLVSEAETSCSQYPNARFSGSRCDLANSVGSCRVVMSNGRQFTIVFYQDGWSDLRAKARCDAAMGAFSY